MNSMNHDPFEPPEGISIAKFRFLMLKRYFEQGYNITGYIKYVIALFGISSLNVSTTMALGFGYAIFCFAVGYWWYRYGFIEIDTEIGNRFNYFVNEMRDKIKK